MPTTTRNRRLLAAALLAVGLSLTVGGIWLETRNPRSNSEDLAALWALFLGMFFSGMGASLPFARPVWAAFIGLLTPGVGWFLFFCAYLFLTRWPSQTQMVPSGYRMIPEARQIDELFGPAWHQLSNYREPDIAEWQTESPFGGGYELEMTVPVRIDRHTGQVVERIGEPRFYLREIGSIRNPLEVNYRDGHEFGPEQWRRVVEAQGDFSAIGIHLDFDHPVLGFDRYRARRRNGIQFRPDGSMISPSKE